MSISQMKEIKLPEILADIPPKLLPFIFEFNDYNYFLAEGGRGSGKTQSIARFFLHIAEKRKVRIVCGRETQNTIDESVKTILSDLIKENSLNFEILDKKIIHRKTGSTFLFKGFREQGKVNIKGLEGVDLLWIDEAQAITKATLDVIIPTIRKSNSKVFFSMNRELRNDAVYLYCTQSTDCLHVNINFYDNPKCPQKLINEANKLKELNISDYNHVWLGLPKDGSIEYLMSSEKIDASKKIEFKKENHCKWSVLSVDLAGSGADQCVAKLITIQSRSEWLEDKTFSWQEKDTELTKAKILELYMKYSPTVLIIDADGLGYSLWCSIKKIVTDCIGFRGGCQAKNQSAFNQRADGYLALKEFIEMGWLKLTCEHSSRQAEYIKKVIKSNGKICIQNKREIKKEQGESPDFADTLMMAIYSIVYHSHLFVDTYAVENAVTHFESNYNPFNDDEEY